MGFVGGLTSRSPELAVEIGAGEGELVVGESVAEGLAEGAEGGDGAALGDAADAGEVGVADPGAHVIDLALLDEACEVLGDGPGPEPATGRDLVDREVLAVELEGSPGGGGQVRAGTGLHERAARLAGDRGGRGLGSRGWFGALWGDDREEGGTVTLGLHAAHAPDLEQTGLGRGALLDHVVEGGIAEDDVGRDALLLGEAAAQRAQREEERGFVVDLAALGGGEAGAAVAARARAVRLPEVVKDTGAQAGGGLGVRLHGVELGGGVGAVRFEPGEVDLVLAARAQRPGETPLARHEARFDERLDSGVDAGSLLFVMVEDVVDALAVAGAAHESAVDLEHGRGGRMREFDEEFAQAAVAGSEVQDALGGVAVPAGAARLLVVGLD